MIYNYLNMEKITRYYLFVLITLCFINCKKDHTNKNVIYLSAAETSVTTSLTADSTGAELAITAKAAQQVTQPVTANIVIDTSLIANYNQLTGKHYSALPQGSYELTSNNVTINAGANVSDAISLKILSTKDFKDGFTYLLPITIKGADGLPVLSASGTLYVIVNRVIISTVASLTNNYFTVDFSKNNDALKTMSSISYETRVMVNQFQSANPYISSIMGIEENFLLRFGDVSIQPNQLQMAGGLTATNVPGSFSTGTWYHIAAVYNGTQLKIYVNGQLSATKDAVRTVDITSGFYFGRSANGRPLNGAISEARVWSKVLTQAEIINGMCGIDPASPGLVGYWKFNEGTGNIAHDISGNGHDATANGTVTWIPNIRCN